MGIDRISTLLICFPSIPCTLPLVWTFFPPSRVQSILPSLPTSPITAHISHLRSPKLITAHDIICHSTQSAAALRSRPMTSPLMTIWHHLLCHRHQWLHLFIIIASSWYIYDITTFRTLMDTFQTHLWCPITFIPPTCFTFIMHHWSWSPVSHSSFIYQPLTPIPHSAHVASFGNPSSCQGLSRPMLLVLRLL